MLIRYLLRYLLRLIGHADFIRFGVRDRFIRFFHNPDTSTSEEFQVPFFGAKYTGNFDTFIDWSVFYYGAYCGEELALMQDILQHFTNPVVLDIGANVGHHTLFAAYHATKVYAFEPFDLVANKLEQKIRQNSLSNVTLFRYALGESDSTADFHIPEGHNTATGSFIRSSHAPSQATRTLTIKNGDKVMLDNKLSPPQFIKIDTEGFERHVLNGIRKTLETSRPVVFFEWTERENSPSSGPSVSLFPSGYVFFVFSSGAPYFGIFKNPNYSLTPITHDWPDGNLLAVPEEYLKMLHTLQPRPSLLRRVCVG